MYRLIPLLFCFPVFAPAVSLFADDPAFVPPNVTENGNVSSTPAPAAAAQPVPAAVPTALVISSRDSVLGDRIAKISAAMDKIPQEHGQIWREYDITPYTKNRKLPNGVSPEQAVIDWILRQTGTAVWHTTPFGILTADSEKLYVYHTKEIQLAVADIVDRFVCPQFWNETCTLRVIALSRPDWITKGHVYLKPIPIAAPGIQGWLLEKTGAQNLLQELGKRNDFKELVPPQPAIANGIPHNIVAKRQRQYLRDVQTSPTVLNGYVEDRAVFEEGIGLTVTPLAMLDGQSTATSVKLDVVQIERMITTMIEVPTSSNPRQRMQIETPQVSVFKLDEMVRFPKNKVLLLDLGSIPLPNTADNDSRNVLSDIAKGINPARRGSVLIFLECSSAGSIPAANPAPAAAVPATAVPATSVAPTNTRTAESLWRGIR